MPNRAGAGAAAGGLAFPPLGLAGLLSFAPGILSGLGLFGEDPQKKLRRQAQRLLSPQEIARLTNQFYQQALGSPAYSQALGTIASGANVAQGQLSRELGARGIGTTGTGAVLSSLLPSLVGSQQAGLRTQAFQGAQQSALENIQRQLALLGQTGGPSQTQQMFGAGLSGFGNILQNYLALNNPQLAALLTTSR